MIDEHLLGCRILHTGGLVVKLHITVEVLIALSRVHLAIDELFAHQDFKFSILFLKLFNVEWRPANDRRDLEWGIIFGVRFHHVLMALHFD